MSYVSILKTVETIAVVFGIGFGVFQWLQFEKQLEQDKKHHSENLLYEKRTNTKIFVDKQFDALLVSNSHFFDTIAKIKKESVERQKQYEFCVGNESEKSEIIDCLGRNSTYFAARYDIVSLYFEGIIDCINLKYCEPIAAKQFACSRAYNNAMLEVLFKIADGLYFSNLHAQLDGITQNYNNMAQTLFDNILGFCGDDFIDGHTKALWNHGDGVRVPKREGQGHFVSYTQNTEKGMRRAQIRPND